MIDVLIKLIPQAVFEPIAVIGLAGLILAAVVYWKRHGILYFPVLIALCLMVFWRVFAHIGSSRYAAILIYPCVIGGAYLIFRTGGFFRRTLFCQKYFPVFLNRHLSTLLLMAFLIASVGRCLHYNPYGDYMIRLAETLAEDAGKYDNVCILSAGKTRLAYYSGLPVTDLGWESDDLRIEKKRIRDIFYSYDVQKHETVYFVLSENAAEPPGYTFEQLSESARKYCTLVGEFYRDTRKKRLTRLFRFDLKKLNEPYQVTLSEFEGNKLPEIEKKKIVFEADFDKKQDALFYEATFDFFDQRADYLEKPVLKDFPATWVVTGTQGFHKNSHSELGLISAADGQTVFRLKSQDLITAYNGKIFVIPQYNWVVEYLVSGTPGTEFSLGFHRYKDGKYAGTMFLPCAVLPDHQTKLYKAVIAVGAFEDVWGVRVAI